MFRRILLAAAGAGLVAGVALTAIQAVKVLPLIAAAEQQEAAAHGDDDAHDEAWAPRDGAPRLTFTLMINILAGIAFALLLVAGLSLRPPADWREGIAWGAAGFVAFSLAPAAGLPPALPGAVEAGLGARQLWWAGTGAATACGLALIAFPPAWWARACGVVLVALPHGLTVPHADHGHGGTVSADLAASFVGAALAASLVFWLVIGGLGAWVFARLAAPAAASARSMR